MVNKSCQESNNYTFLHSTCFQQPQNNLPQQFVSVSPHPNQTANMYNYMYTNQVNQNVYRTSYPEYSAPSYLPNEHEALKAKYAYEKSNTIEILPKDLSPSCSNFDLLFPDIEKTLVGAKSDRKELPSCSQQMYYEGLNDLSSKDMKSCGLSKVCEIDYLCNELNGSDALFGQYMQANDKGLKSCYTEGTYKFFGQNEGEPVPQQNEVPILSQCYLQPQTPLGGDSTFMGMEVLDEGLDDSNEGSDIIVEESDEEVSELREDIVGSFECTTQCATPSITQCAKQPTTQCFICSCLYIPLSSQFYLLTPEFPVTMSTQKPVYSKLKEILGDIIELQCYLCIDCLGLLNNLDHLGVSWENCRNDLLMKFGTAHKDIIRGSSNIITGNTIQDITIKDCDRAIQNDSKTIKDASKTSFDVGETVLNCLEFKYRTNKSSYLKLKSRKKRRYHENYRKNFYQKKYKCKLCEKVISIQSIYSNHLKKHLVKDRFLCETCGASFSKFNQLSMHREVHRGSKILKIDAFTCSICEKPFRTRSHREEHENFCSGKLPHACKHCDKKFASPSKLKSHLKLKHDKKFSSICSICNIGFVKISDYKAHVSSHSTDKKYACVKCGKSYKTPSNLNFHLKFHDAKLPFECSICRKGFMRKDYLEAHLQKHNGVKNFTCALCDKRFTSQKNLDAHIKHHDGSLPKKTCNICGKTMTSGMEEHVRIHNNLREFECSLCSLKFNTKGALAKHKKRKHV